MVIVALLESAVAIFYTPSELTFILPSFDTIVLANVFLNAFVFYDSIKAL